MYKIDIINKKTKEVITYNNVDDDNRGEKLYYKFAIDATSLNDGEYTLNVYDGDDNLIATDTLNVGLFDVHTLQYERGNNIYVSTNLTTKTEEKSIKLDTINLTVTPTDGVDAMTSVKIDATLLYDNGYSVGYENGASDGYDNGYREGNNIGYNDGYSKGTTDGYNEGVREQKSKLTSIDITQNGTYTTEDGYSNVNVNVQSDSYSYKVNTVDEDGLRQLGWDDASIGYFKDNNLHYEYQNDEYVVSEENIALKDVIKTGSDMKNNLTNPNLIYAPLFNTNDLNSGENLFKKCTTLKGIPKINLQNWEYCNYMFAGCTSLTTIPQLDTSKVKHMPYMFSACSSLTSLPLLDVSNVTTMYKMFNHCSSLTTIPLLNTSNVTNMDSMFYSCSSLISLPLLDVSNVTNMSSMFDNCSSLTSLPLLDVSNVTTMFKMFNRCSSLTTIPLLNTSNVTSMSSMFDSCSSLTSLPLLNTSNVTNMDGMFYNCSSLQSIPLLDVSNVTKFGTFFGYSDIKTLTDLGGFKNLKIDWKDTYGLYKLPNLTYQSIMNVINNLYDFRANGDTTTTRTLKINSNTMALLTDDDKALATSKGWILS